MIINFKNMFNIKNIKNSKKIIIIFSLILAILLLIIIFFIFKNKNKAVKEKSNINTSTENTLMTETTFGEREDIIKQALIDKFDLSSDQLSVFIARENETHINGAFFVNGTSEENSFNGYFFAVVDNNKINIVWADKENVDCSIIDSYNFPKEMAPNCF
jgi:hypothetical protein